MFDEILHEPKTIAFLIIGWCAFIWLENSNPIERRGIAIMQCFITIMFFAFSNQDNTVIAMNLTQMAVLLF